MNARAPARPAPPPAEAAGGVARSARVLFLDHTAALGGAELCLLSYVARTAHRAHVVLFEDGPFRAELEGAGVSTQVVPAPAAVGAVSREGGLGADLRAAPGLAAHAWSVARLARAHDVVYANSQKAMVVAAVAGVLARRPVVWHLHDLITAGHFSRAHRAVAVGAGYLAARVVANSGATHEAFAAAGGPSRRTVAVHNGIDPRPFADGRGGDVRRDLGVGAAPLVGLFSRLAPWKGQHVLIEALRDVPEAHALLVGDALFGDERRYADALRRRVAEAGLAGRVHFLGFRRDVPDLLAAVDVVVHASTAPEPFGRVIVEGMLAGRPVVATAAGGALEILTDGETGRLVPPGDAHALGRALADLLARPHRASRVAAAGQREARERFSLDAMVRRLDGHVADVVQGRRGAAGGAAQRPHNGEGGCP